MRTRCGHPGRHRGLPRAARVSPRLPHPPPPSPAAASAAGGQRRTRARPAWPRAIARRRAVLSLLRIRRQVRVSRDRGPQSRPGRAAALRCGPSSLALHRGSRPLRPRTARPGGTRRSRSQRQRPCRTGVPSDLSPPEPADTRHPPSRRIPCPGARPGSAPPRRVLLLAASTGNQRPQPDPPGRAAQPAARPRSGSSAGYSPTGVPAAGRRTSATRSPVPERPKL